MATIPAYVHTHTHRSYLLHLKKYQKTSTFLLTITHTYILWASLMTQLVKNPPAMQETWVQSLGWEDPLEKGKATFPFWSGPVFWPGEFRVLDRI